MPNSEALFAIIVFSFIGLGAFRWGKKDGRWQPIALGIALMIFPYFISSTLWLYLTGTLLTLGLFIFRD